MHQVIRKKYGFSHVLELSSKSGNKLSFPLSPLSLKVTNEHDGQAYSVENALQASKVFENGGPYLDLLTVAPRQAKKDERLTTSGELIGYDGGVLKSMLTSDIAIIDIKEHQIEYFKVIIKLF